MHYLMMMHLPRGRRSASLRRPPLQEVGTYSRMREEEDALRESTHPDSASATRGSSCIEDQSDSIPCEDRTGNTPSRALRWKWMLAPPFWRPYEAPLVWLLPCYRLVRKANTTRFPRDTPSPSPPFLSSRTTVAAEERANSYPPIHQVAAAHRHPSSDFAPPTSGLASYAPHSPPLLYLPAPPPPL